MSLYQKFMMFWGRDYVLLKRHDDLRIRRVRWISGRPYARTHESLQDSALELHKDGSLKGYMQKWEPISEKISHWCECTGGKHVV